MFEIQDSTDNESFKNTGEHTPVGYPRSESDRSLSNNNKGGASVDSGPGTVQYDVGPYPAVEVEADENDGASR